MKRKILTVAATSSLAFALFAAAPAQGGSSAPPGPVGTAAAAAVSKSLGGGGGGGGGSISGAGDRLGELLSGWAVPVITVLAGCLLVGALASRNIGASLGIVVVSLIGLIFLLSPQSIESLAKGIASFVF